MVWESYDPKPFDETDVDIKISHCGVSYDSPVFHSRPSTLRIQTSITYVQVADHNHRSAALISTLYAVAGVQATTQSASDTRLLAKSSESDRKYQRSRLEIGLVWEHSVHLV